jgi:hypothetical protein
MDTSKTKSTATDAFGTGNSALSGPPKASPSADRLTILTALARLESDLEAFIETTDLYLCKLTDSEYYNVPGHNQLGDCFADAARMKRELSDIRRRLE